MTDTVTVVRLPGRTIGVRLSGQSGADGDDGVTPELQLGTVTTVAPGEDAAAALVEVTPNVYRLDLSIPAGETGADGAGIVTGVTAPLAIDGDGILSVDLSGVEVDLSDYATLVALGAVSDAVDALQVDVAGLVSDLAALTTTVAGKASQADLDGLAADLTTVAGGLAAHLADGNAAHAASAVSFTPAGTIAATDVQAAVAELDGDARMSDARTPTAHAASHQDGGTDELALDGSQITTGTVADARIAATIARDSEVTSAVASEATARDTAIALAIANLIASAPGVLDTLDEIAAALGDDPNFAATITTALAGKQPLDAELTALATLTSASNKLPYFSAASAASLADFTAFARTLLDDADATAARLTLGLVLGTDIYSKSAVDSGFQPLDGDLTAIAALVSAANKIAYATGAGTWSLADFTVFARTILDDPDAATVRATLGLGTAAVLNSGTASGDIPLLSTGGRLPIARIASGTPDGTKFVRDDGTLAVPAGATAVTIAYATLASDTSITSSTWGAVATATDLVLAAIAGDRIEVGLACRIDNANAQLFQDVYSMVAGSPVNSLGLTGAAPVSTSGTGVLPWVADNSQFFHPSGSIFYVVQAGDLSGGNITIRWYARRTTANKLISGGSRIHAKNWRQ